jgi:hypothetical protein
MDAANRKPGMPGFLHNPAFGVPQPGKYSPWSNHYSEFFIALLVCDK